MDGVIELIGFASMAWATGYTVSLKILAFKKFSEAIT